MSEARDAVINSDLLIVMGTSLEAGPVNQLPYILQYPYVKPTLWVSRDKPSLDYEFSHSWRGELADFVAAHS